MSLRALTSWNISCVAAAFCICSSALLAQPKIKHIPDISLGDAYQGQKMHHVMNIQNIGTDTLRISEVKAQCGCTATLLSENDIAPHRKAKLSFTFDTHNYTGQVSKQIYISSNDAATPKLTVNFTANILRSLIVIPQFLSFENAKRDSLHIKTLAITNPSPTQVLTISSIKPRMENLTVKLVKQELKPGERTEIQASYRPKKDGTFQGTIELQTNHPQNPKVEIRVYSWVTRK